MPGNCIYYTKRAFNYHQTKYLKPSVRSVWKYSQQELLPKCTSPLVIAIGGDGRSDNPGNSAKYVS